MTTNTVSRKVAWLRVVTLAVAAFLAGRMTKSIVQPINDLNLEDPENSKVYDELAPLLLRLSRQNDQIGRSLRELSRRQQGCPSSARKCRQVPG